MKKLLFALALCLGLGTSFASASIISNLSSSETVLVSQDLTPIEVKDLPEAVQKTIAEKFAESTIKAAFLDAKEDGSKFYKVVLVDKESKEFEAFFNEKGEIVEPAKN